MLFGRKRNINLYHGMVGEAIAISSKYNFKKDNPSYRDKKLKAYIEERIDVDEHISFAIYSRHYANDFSVFGGYPCYIHYYSMDIETYVDNILVNKYTFSLDMKNNDKFYREWTLDEKRIIHPLPQEIIIKMNQWAKEVVQEKHRELNEEKEKRMQKQTKVLSSEEDKLKEIYQNYK